MSPGKLCTRADLHRRASQLPRPWVFTNGVFDLLHRGHVEYLQAARRLGAMLMVGVNSDDSVRVLGKGPGRPLNPAEDRATVIAALECVSLVVVFHEPTPASLLAELRPEWYAKGGDYHGKPLPETALVQQWGGEAVVLDHWRGRSTTTLIHRAHQTFDQENADDSP